MEPAHTCKLFGAIRAVLGIKNALPIIHGPVGCTYHIRYLLEARSGSKIRLCSTELTQEDVVFGAEEKLSKAIIDADKLYSPDLIVVLNSCSTSIIGEDIFRISRECKPELKSDIIAISAGGFEGDQTDGYNEVIMALIDWAASKTNLDNLDPENIDLLKNNYLLQECFNKKRKRALEGEDKPHILDLVTQIRKNKIFPHKNKSLNLIGVFRGGPDLKNLENSLNQMDVELNCVFNEGNTLDDIKTFYCADLNYSMCDVSGIEPCMTLKEKFSMDFLHYPFPLGFSNTYNFFKNIITFLDVEYSLENEKNYFYQIRDQYKQDLDGYKVAIIAGPTRGVAMLDFVLELGMHPVLISMDILGTYTLENINKIIGERNLNSDKMPEILQKPDLIQIEDSLLEKNPDLLIGGLGEIGFSRELKTPLLDVMHAQQLTLGWEGAVQTAENIHKALNL